MEKDHTINLPRITLRENPLFSSIKVTDDIGFELRVTQGEPIAVGSIKPEPSSGPVIQEWQFIEADLLRKGYVPKEVVIPLTEDIEAFEPVELFKPELSQDEFIDACLRHALVFKTNAAAMFAVAWAQSGKLWEDGILKTPTDGNHSGFGPFQFTKTGWNRLIVHSETGRASAGDIKYPIIQTVVSAFLFQKATKAISDQLDDREASTLDLFMAQLFSDASKPTDQGEFNADAVITLIKKLKDTPNISIDELLGTFYSTDSNLASELKKRHPDLLTKGGVPTIKEFWERCEKLIDKALEFVRDEIGKLILVAPSNATDSALWKSDNPSGTILALGKNEIYREDLLFASSRTGINPVILATLIDAEAKKDNGVWDKNSKNTDTSASGLTQFLNATWEEMARRSGTFLNVSGKENSWITSNNKIKSATKQQLMDLRFNPRQSIVASAEYANQNIQILKKKGNHYIPNDISEDKLARHIYYAHHDGATGATWIIDNKFPEAKAKNKYPKNVPASERAVRLARNGNSYSKAYVEWIKDYTKKKIILSNFQMEIETEIGTNQTIVVADSSISIPNSGDLNRDFSEFIGQLNLKNFKPYEFLKLGGSNDNPNSRAYKKNTLPPRHLWPNIVATSQVLDELRMLVDAPIFTTSTYRSQAYNNAIGGASNSLHKEFNAVDFYVTSTTSRPSDWAAALKNLRDNGLFKGGIGTYSGFVHIDTRGKNATW